MDRNGFCDWLATDHPDVLCLQEVKLDDDSLPMHLRAPIGYHGSFNFGNRKGHSGVATYSLDEPISVTYDIFAPGTGRTLLTEFSTIAVLNVYMPHGARDKSRLAEKLTAYESLRNFAAGWDGKPLIIAGDFNVARDDIDLARPRENRRNVMFTPEERMALQAVLVAGYRDAFRELNPDIQAFTWWPYMAQARERNIGWRIDYIFMHQSISRLGVQANILRSISGSDHCPISIQLITGSGGSY